MKIDVREGIEGWMMIMGQMIGGWGAYYYLYYNFYTSFLMFLTYEKFTIKSAGDKYEVCTKRVG